MGLFGKRAHRKWVKQLINIHGDHATSNGRTRRPHKTLIHITKTYEPGVGLVKIIKNKRIKFGKFMVRN